MDFNNNENIDHIKCLKDMSIKGYMKMKAEAQTLLN